MGKPTGNDIKEKKLTLPLIYTLNNVDRATRRNLIYIVKNENKNAEKVKMVIDTVISAGGISYAAEKMNAYRDEALHILYAFPTTKCVLPLKICSIYYRPQILMTISIFFRNIEVRISALSK